MPQVLVRQCSLRIVRRGGWSWGADASTLIRQAVRVLGEVVARQLLSIFPDDDADRRLDAPVRARVCLRLSELLAVVAAHDAASSGATAGAGSAVTALDRRMRESLVAAFGEDAAA